MKVTSAYANKLLRQLNDDKAYWLEIENTCSTYVAANGEEAVIPEYDYLTFSKKISEFFEKIVKIKQAIKVLTASTVMTIKSGAVMTIDQALVAMAQLSSRKLTLDYMRKRQPKQRSRDNYARPNNVIEFTYINYDLELVKADYERISEDIMDIQMQLDKLNQTVEFDIDL